MPPLHSSPSSHRTPSSEPPNKAAWRPPCSCRSSLTCSLSLRVTPRWFLCSGFFLDKQQRGAEALSWAMGHGRGRCPGTLLHRVGEASTAGTWVTMMLESHELPVPPRQAAPLPCLTPATAEHPVTHILSFPRTSQHTQGSPNSQALGLSPPLWIPAPQPTVSQQPPACSPPPSCSLLWDVLSHPEEQMSLILTSWGCRVLKAEVLGGVPGLAGTPWCLLQPGPFLRHMGGPVLQDDRFFSSSSGSPIYLLSSQQRLLPMALLARRSEKGLLLPWSPSSTGLYPSWGQGPHLHTLHHEVPGAPPGCCGP